MISSVSPSQKKRSSVGPKFAKGSTTRLGGVLSRDVADASIAAAISVDESATDETRSHEPIATFGNGLDVLALPGVISERASQICDRPRQRRIRDEPTIPDRLDELVPGDDFSLVRTEKNQEVHDLRFEVTNRSAGASLIERRLDLPSAYSQVGGGAVPAALPNGHAADSRPLHRQLAPATSEVDPKGIRRTLCRRESILCPMDRERIVERYFDAWIARDALAIVSTFTDGGTYLDPTTPVALVGDAIGEYARRLWSAFPDLTFEIRKRTGSGIGDLAAEWTMRGNQ